MSRLTIIADENIPKVEEYFSALGDVLIVDGRQLSNRQVIDADILLVRSVTPVNRLLLQGSKVRFVATATIGFDHLDIDYLQSAGIAWASAPGCNADSVVDYIFSAFCRLDGVLAHLLADGVVGIIGMGNVGGRLYQRLSQLNITCRCYDPLIPQDRFPVLTDIDSVLRSDVLCLHAPLTFEGDNPTYHLLDERRLQQLKPGTVLINAGRGAVVDNQALKQQLSCRDDLCVVLDVWEGEPKIDSDLLKRVDLGTSHIAGYSLDGKLQGTQMIYQACCEFLDIKVSVSDSVEENDLSIKLDPNQSVVSSIKDVVLAIYDLGRDDQNLRGALLHGAAEKRKLGFDQLRKNYPERREFSRFSISNSQELTTEIINSLTALGVSC
ncbi:MAG: 4-phosphoerythronate dehydrogenase [Pseudomonadales bacterium]